MTDTPPKDQVDANSTKSVDESAAANEAVEATESTEAANSADTATTTDETIDTETPVPFEAESVLLQQVLEYKTAAQRATADYRNLQRDTEERLSNMRKFSNEQLLVDFCPLVDYFDSAFAAIPAEQKSEAWIKGIKHIQDYLMQIMKNNGVERMVTIGQPFNPELHESVGETESDQPEHTIIKELQAGFILNGRVIRPARVMLAKAQGSAEANAEADINKKTNQQLTN